MLRTETDLTNLLFTATDKNNRYITTLQQSDIRVLEDSVPQSIFTFQRETDRPLAIAFVIDVSISEERTLPDEKAAARSFIENVIRSEKDQAAIIRSKATRTSSNLCRVMCFRFIVRWKQSKLLFLLTPEQRLRLAALSPARER